MLSLDQIRRLADLARLELSEAQAAAMQQELNGILALVDQMAAVDTEGVEPMSHPQGRDAAAAQRTAVTEFRPARAIPGDPRRKSRTASTSCRR